MQQEKIKVLFIEDNEIVNLLVEEVSKDIKNIELTIIKTRTDAIKILNVRKDFQVAFVDWHLDRETSEWLIKLIKDTQMNISIIFWTSDNEINREFQKIEWADFVHDKTKISESLLKVSSNFLKRA